MDNNKKTHLVYWISGGLVMSFIFSLIGSFFPAQSVTQTILFKIDALFAISAFACLASKASSEKMEIPAAGFTVLAIAQGLFLSEIDSPDHWDYQSANTAVLFMVPAVIMIYYYTVFPKWLRIIGVISLIPFMALFIIRLIIGFGHTALYENIIFLIYQVITLCWAWQIWKEE